MLQFTTTLFLKDSFTKKDFLELVIEWNQGSIHPENIIPNLEWNGEYNVHFGSNDLWLESVEYENGNIVAVRYEKTDKNGIVWDSDYIVDFNMHKMVIRLDKSYSENADLVNPGFSTPHFITLMIEKGYLADDGNLPVNRTPIGIDCPSAAFLHRILTGQRQYRLPIIYVSKCDSGSYPVNLSWLSSRLKGAAHVMAQKNVADSKAITWRCGGCNPQNGEIAILYYSGNELKKQFFNYSENMDKQQLLDGIVSATLELLLLRKTKILDTWQGVNNAVLSERLERQRLERNEAEESYKKNEDEIYLLCESYEEDIENLKKHNEELLNKIGALENENAGLRFKQQSYGNNPIIYAGNEKEYFPDEIRMLVLASLKDAAENMKEESRRRHIILDILQNNKYNPILEERHQKIKNLLKGYTTMSGAMKQELIDMGFDISDDGKHYKLTYFGDNRYMSVLSKTASDFRSGKNNAAVICRDMM